MTAALDSASYDYVRSGLLPEGRKTEPREVQLSLHDQLYRINVEVIADIGFGKLATITDLLEVSGL